MEDIFKFLLVAGVIVISFIRQTQKEAKKKVGNAPATPVPDDGNPFPEDRNDETYGGYIPQGRKPEAAAAHKKKGKKHKPAATTTPAATAAGRTPAQQSNDYTSPETDNNVSEFEIRSAEEARKAIIWGEILQRKY